MFLGHPADKLFDEFFARAKQIFESDRCLRQPFEPARKFLRDVQPRGREDFRHRAVVAEDVDDERFSQVRADSLVREKFCSEDLFFGSAASPYRREQTGDLKTRRATPLRFTIGASVLGRKFIDKIWSKWAAVVQPFPPTLSERDFAQEWAEARLLEVVGHIVNHFLPRLDLLIGDGCSRLSGALVRTGGNQNNLDPHIFRQF